MTTIESAKPSHSASAGSPGLAATLRSDITASLVVFLVALPLSMGIAIASGRSAASGLISAMIGGIVVGLLGGSPLQVSGPAAGLAVIVYEVGRESGAAGLAFTVLVAGLVQMATGLLRWGIWFRAVSPAVIHGMLAGIGVLIFASQFHVMVDDPPRANGIENITAIPDAIYKGIFPLDESVHHQAAQIGMATIIIIMAWKAAARGPLKIIPPPLAAVLISSCAAWAFGSPIKRVDVPHQLTEAVEWLPWDFLRANLTNGHLWLEGIAMALVASAETLLCATALDQRHSGPRTRYDRELFAQGFGNGLCGLMGALPITGVIVRSAANLDAGAKTRLSAILHGVWVLAAVAAIPTVLERVPTAALAAVLVYTGFKLVDVKAIMGLAKFGRGEVAIALVTIVAIVSTDLLKGVVTGIALAAIKLLYTMSHLVIRIEDRPHRNQTILYLRGTATFLALPKLAAALEGVRPSTELHVQLERLDYIDHACLDLLINWEKQHEATGGRLVIDWDFLTASFRRGDPEPPVGAPPAAPLRA